MASVGTKLSIIVLSITERHKLLSRLLGLLSPQITKEVELLVSTTGVEESIGAKRERLKQAACGDFICFVDDDDLVSLDYVGEIIRAIDDNPVVGCIGFRGTLECPNGKVFDVNYSLRNRDRIGRDGNTFFCGPGHLTPIRREIVQSVRFADKDSGEDGEFCKEVMKLIGSETYIDKVLYRYLASYNV